MNLLSPLLSFLEDISLESIAIKMNLPNRVRIPLCKKQNDWNIYATARIYVFPHELFGAVYCYMEFWHLINSNMLKEKLWSLNIIQSLNQKM